MSEYQYYEFRALDRKLTATEIEELGELSSRAEITETSFTNTYSYGDFRGKPDRLMEKYFDIFVYVANWGTRRLAIRLPRRGVDETLVNAYAGGGVSLSSTSDFVIISLEFDLEGGAGWEVGEAWMPKLIGLRDELLNGDLRPLYLGWLSGVYGDMEDDEPEPPVPAGIRMLTPAQSNLVDFLRIDQALLEVAAEASSDRTESPSLKTELADWLRSQTATEKDAWLGELLGESSQAARSNLLLQFRQWLRASRGHAATAASHRRTGQELREASERRSQELERQHAEAETAKRIVQAEQDAKKRTVALNQLARRVDAAWQAIEQQVATKQPKEYGRAVEQLVDLRDLAARDGQSQQFAVRLADLVHSHSKKPAFLKRLKNAGLEW